MDVTAIAVSSYGLAYATTGTADVSKAAIGAGIQVLSLALRICAPLFTGPEHPGLLPMLSLPRRSLSSPQRQSLYRFSPFLSIPPDEVL